MAESNNQSFGCIRRNRISHPAGISLLEVVLALAILGLAAAYLAQSMELATTNAVKSQNLTQAELVAESVMNQVIAGLIPPDPVSWTPYYNSYGQTDWMYQLQNVPTEVEFMVGLQVAVQQLQANGTQGSTAYDLYANRWIIDPALGLDTPPEEEEGYGDEGYGGESYGGETGGGATGSGGNAAAGAQGGAGLGAGFGGFGAGGGGRGGPGGAGGRGGGGPGGARGGGQGGGARGGGQGGGARGGGQGGGARGGGQGGGARGGGQGGGPAGGGRAGGGGGFGGFGAGGPGGGGR